MKWKQTKLSAGTASSSCRPKCIIFLERTSSPGQCFLPNIQKRTQEFFETSAERLPDELSSAKQTRSEIIQQLQNAPLGLLRTGDSPQETAEAIEIFLSEVAVEITESTHHRDPLDILRPVRRHTSAYAISNCKRSHPRPNQ